MTRRNLSRHVLRCPRSVEPLESRCLLDSTVVISEIMYHPTDVNEQMEWVELHNQLSTNIDLTGWSLQQGIDYQFPDGTIISGGQRLVVAKSPDALQQATGVAGVLGPFSRNLNNAGDRVALVNNSQRIMSDVRYADDGPWPVGPDGSGASLSKIDEMQSSEDARNWSFSRRIGGTPGAANDAHEGPSLVINEVGAANASWRLELLNVTDVAMQLSDFALHRSETSPVILPTATVEPQQMVTLTSDQLAAGAVGTGERIFLITADGTQLLDAIDVEERARGRYPDGGNDWRYVDATTFGSPNVVTFRDQIVINEIMFNHRDHAAAGPNALPASPEEWIELFNRSDQPVDLSGWRLADAVQFDVPEGTVLQPGEYGVVAHDLVPVRARFPDARYLGSYLGRLSDKSERILLLDAHGNPADDVHYYDASPWPSYADGRHSSVELIDANADNGRPEAWSASDESGRSAWQTYSYRGVAGPGDSGTPDYHELVVGLLDQGELLLDDVRVVENPDSTARQLIQNGDFQQGTSDTWRVIGNHSATVVTDPDEPQNQVLHLIATGRTDDIHNHAETTLKSGETFVEVTPGTEYEISFRAKWLAGSNQFHTRLYFNELPRAHLLDVPLVQGTPGQPNLVRRDNVGPTYTGLEHFPIFPEVDEPVQVTVRADDPDGVQSMTLYYTKRSEWTAVEMQRGEDAQFTGMIPGQTARSQVVFYVEGTDTLGATTTYPAAGPDARAMYVVQDNRARDHLNNFRMIITNRDASSLHRSTNLMSNQRIRGTVVFNETEVYYNVAIRLSGASSSRQTINNGYNIRFEADQPFLGVHDSVTVDRNNLNEILIRHLINAAGGVPGLYNDAVYFMGPGNGRRGYAQLRMARYDDVYLSSQFLNGNEGRLFEKELTYRQGLSSAGNPESLKWPLGYTHPIELNTDIQDFGDDKEAYRWHWLPKNHRDQDDFTQVISLNKAFDLSGQAMEQAVGAVVDVDQWLRTFATMRLFGNRDFYSQPSGAHGHWKHNFFIFVRPEDQRVLVLPWDIDENFQIPTDSTLFGVGNISQWIQFPNNLHYYYGHMDDALSTSFNESYMAPWIEHFDALFPTTTANFSAPQRYLPGRFDFVRSQLPEAVDFDVLTADGITVDSSVVTVHGSGWVNVREIRLAGQSDPVNVQWETPTTWRADVPLVPGDNILTFEAYDFRGHRIETPADVSLTVTSDATMRPQLQHARITELNYHPSNPTALEIAAGHDRDDDFEYLEVTNTGDTVLDLTGLRLTQGVEFDFSESTVTSLDPGRSVLIVEDVAAARFRFGNDVAVAGQWAGGLDGGGETIQMVDRFGSTIHAFTYDDRAPWPTAADGQGATLEVLDPEGDYDSSGNWIASIPGGTPGLAAVGSRGDLDNNGVVDVNDIDRLAAELRTAEPRTNFDVNLDRQVNQFDLNFLVQNILSTDYGDANLDGKFDSDDLLLAFQQGEYEDAIDLNSTWASGDWDGNGDFQTDDLLLAFSTGTYDTVAATRRATILPVMERHTRRPPATLLMAPVRSLTRVDAVTRLRWLDPAAPWTSPFELTDRVFARFDIALIPFDTEDAEKKPFGVR